MGLAYVDTSCLVAIAFGERGGTSLAGRLAEFDELLSSNLLEAELRGAFRREEIPFEPSLVSWISWVLPDRPLSRELARTLEVGYLRGGDLWHVSCALYLVENTAEISFLTLDERQRAVAEGLGFRT